jgi:beta-1,4-mannosyl-glycoprotein beta-1,4-N-acetylglucosaminyltransferase
MMQPHRIYDCFCFFNEADLLQLRLETLSPLVDVFVLVESTRTFTGIAKPLYYNPERFGDYSKKIRHVIVDEFPFDFSDPWRVERYQRNAIAQGIRDAAPSDWIMVGDVDEIPDPQKIASFQPMRYIRGDFNQRYFAYYLNNCQVDESGNPITWFGTKITTKVRYDDFFGCSEQVRRFKGSGITRVFQRQWFHRFQTQQILDGGWHFSWLNGAESIATKLSSFSHQELNTAEVRDLTSIKASVDAGRDIFGSGARFVAVNVDSSFPKPLLVNPFDYAHLISEKVVR